MSTNNPLSKYFRQAQMHVKLPSNGRWYPPESINVPVTKEFPVFAMTAKDELTLMTPDALLNGQSTVEVIQSCMPNIKNAWHMPAIDVDPALIAIRRATYGNSMSLTSLCPHCKNKNEHNINLEFIANKFKSPEFTDRLVINELEFYLKPQTYEQVNKSNLEKFEQQRLLSVVADKDIPADQKQREYSKLFYRILDLTVEQVSLSVLAIKMPDGTVIDSRIHIDEFMKNCDKEIWNQVKNQITDLTNINPLQNIDLECEIENCKKSYSTPLVFENSNFFG